MKTKEIIQKLERRLEVLKENALIVEAAHTPKVDPLLGVSPVFIQVLSMVRQDLGVSLINYQVRG